MHTNLRFIHSADLHLDSLFKTKGHLPSSLLKRMRASTFEAFDRLIHHAIEYDVDFVLLVGDLFNESIRSLKAQVHLRRGFERLNKKGISVYVSYGNHDFLNGNRYPITYPDNVLEFNRQQVDVLPFYRGKHHLVNLYGFSYEDRAVRERKVSEFIKEGSPDYHIALLHGSVDTNTEHDVYAPFRLEEVYERNMDYWALGHIHQRQTLSEDPIIAYPGNIQGRSRKESGEKGCYIVENKDGEWDRKFLPLHSFIYDSVTMPCDDLQSPQELEYVFERAKEKCRSTSVMLEVKLTSTTGYLRKWQSEGWIDEWVDLMNDAEEFEERWVWIDRCEIVDKPSWDETELIESNHFTGELLREASDVSEEEIDRWLSPLYKHRKASKYLTSLSEEEILDIVELAKNMNVEQLLKREENLQ